MIIIFVCRQMWFHLGLGYPPSLETHSYMTALMMCSSQNIVEVTVELCEAVILHVISVKYKLWRV